MSNKITPPKRITRKRLAEIWCELNKYGTPKEFNSKKRRHQIKFNHDRDAIGAMMLIEAFLPWDEIKAEWMKK